MTQPYAIAYFITPHGYGHASRAAGVMAAVSGLDPTIRFEIFTLVPQWFFDTSLSRPYGYHTVLTDIGVAQDTALQENLSETLHLLADFIPFDSGHIKSLATQVIDLGCDAILCDIAPLGIAVAKAANLPSILVENFTWDWIYEGYLPQEPQLRPYVDFLSGLLQKVDYRIQTQPICDIQSVDLTTAPISRAVRNTADQIRQQLCIEQANNVVMVTMGGIPWDYDDLSQLEAYPDCVFIVPGASNQIERRGSLIALPHHSDFFHPDLINAADAVIGKVGYSTIAEVYQAGVPYGYIARSHFRESPPLVEFIQREMQGVPISPEQFSEGRWLEYVPELLRLPRNMKDRHGGAEQVAKFVIDVVSHQ